MGKVIVRQASDGDMGDVQRLCWDYRAVLAEVTAPRPDIIDFYYAETDYAALMHALPQKHARPHGAIFVAELDGAVVGCGMTHRIDAASSEIKRVFVNPAARGHGVASQIVEAAKAQAKADGYRRMVLDSIIWLADAVRLYDHLGFTPCPPYYAPDPRLDGLIIFREIAL